MRKLLLSALVASGLTLSGAGAYALNDQPTEPQSEEQKLDEGTELEQQQMDQGAETEAVEQERPAPAEGAIEEEGSMEETSAPEQEQTEGEFQSTGDEYVVQEGDTLAGIAQEKLGSADEWQSIAEANNLENPNQLEVGQRLTIPSGEEANPEESEFEGGEFEERSMEQSAPEESEPVEQSAPEQESAPGSY